MRISTFKAGLIAVSNLVLLGTGCGINKEIHQKALDDLASCKKDLEACLAARSDADRHIDEIGGKLEKERQAHRQTKALLDSLQANLKTNEQELEELRKQRAAADARLAAFRQLKDKLRALVDTGKLKVVFRKGQMVLALPAAILFPSGKAELSQEGMTALGEVAGVLLEFKDRRFMIAGHTDTQPIKTKRFPNNWHLSTARAVSVVEFFIEKGFLPANVAATGYGEFDPVAANDTPENLAANRRIEIILVPDLSELPTLTGE